MLKKDNPGFAQCACKKPLVKFRSRDVYALVSSTIRFAYWCIGWAKHGQKKAALKLHMVANVRSRPPHFYLVDKAKDHDSKKADELLASLEEGDIAILERAYNAFAKLYRHHQRGGFFVVREKDRVKSKVAKTVSANANLFIDTFSFDLHHALGARDESYRQAGKAPCHTARSRIRPAITRPQGRSGPKPNLQ